MERLAHWVREVSARNGDQELEHNMRMMRMIAYPPDTVPNANMHRMMLCYDTSRRAQSALRATRVLFILSSPARLETKLVEHEHRNPRL